MVEGIPMPMTYVKTTNFRNFSPRAGLARAGRVLMEMNNRVRLARFAAFLCR